MMEIHTQMERFRRTMMDVEFQLINPDVLQGSLPTPIETDIEFQRAFSASFDRLPSMSYRTTRGPLVFKLVNLIIKELLPHLWIIFRLGRTP